MSRHKPIETAVCLAALDRPSAALFQILEPEGLISPDIRETLAQYQASPGFVPLNARQFFLALVSDFMRPDPPPDHPLRRPNSFSQAR